jgi:hypothetical protein
MAAFSHIQAIVRTQQSPGDEVNASFSGRFSFGDTCRTAADVRARAAVVRAWRERVFRQSPAAPQEKEPVAVSEVETSIAVPEVAEEEISFSPAVIADNDNVAEFPWGRFTVRTIIEVAAAHFKTTAEALRSHSRTLPLVRQRQVAAFVARQTTARSLPFIGKKMGGRDHSTILHAVRTVQARIDAGDADTIAAVNAITAQVTGQEVANV